MAASVSRLDGPRVQHGQKDNAEYGIGALVAIRLRPRRYLTRTDSQTQRFAQQQTTCTCRISAGTLLPPNPSVSLCRWGVNPRLQLSFDAGRWMMRHREEDDASADGVSVWTPDGFATHIIRS